MFTDGNYNQALASFSRRKNVTSEFTIEEWLAVLAEDRERLFFVAGVVDAEILQRFREGIEDVIAARKDLTTVEKEIFMWLRDRGYKPTDGKEGSFDDLSSLERIMFELQPIHAAVGRIEGAPVVGFQDFRDQPGNGSTRVERGNRHLGC